MNLLIFKVNQLGDNVLFLPVIQALRRLRPDWKLRLFTSPVAAPLYEGILDAQDIHVVETRDFNSAWRNPSRLLALRNRVCAGRTDAVILGDDQGNVAHLLAWLSGARVRVGAALNLTKLGRCLTHAVQPPADTGIATHNWEIARTCLRVFGDLDWPACPPQPDLAHLLGDAKPAPRRVVIHPGGSLPYKRWPLDSFRELAGRLAHDVETVWIDHAATPAPTLERGITRAAPKTIGELTRVIATASLFIGNNSGPMNLAFALGRPSVILNGPSTAAWDPSWQRERHLILRDVSLPCSPCDTAFKPALVCRNPLAPMTCMTRWNVATVEAQCRNWLRRWAPFSEANS